MADDVERCEGVPLGLLPQQVEEVVVLLPEAAGDGLLDEIGVARFVDLAEADRLHNIPDVMVVFVVAVNDPAVGVVAGLVEVLVPVLEFLRAVGIGEDRVDRLGRDKSGARR